MALRYTAIGLRVRTWEAIWTLVDMHLPWTACHSKACFGTQ